MTYKPLAIHFSAVFHCVTDQEHEVGNLGIDPGESVIYKNPTVLLAFFFLSNTFLSVTFYQKIRFFRQKQKCSTNFGEPSELER